jgi:hypothetical protein
MQPLRPVLSTPPFVHGTLGVSFSFQGGGFSFSLLNYSTLATFYSVFHGLVIRPSKFCI